MKTTIDNISYETIANNLQNIVNEIVQKQVKDTDLALSQYIIKKQNDEKLQLISFLEDKIKLCDDNIKSFLKEKERSMFYDVELAHLKNIKGIFQAILDYVKGE